MTSALEEKVKALLAEFVATLAGRYTQHMSDACLTAVLLQRLVYESQSGGHRHLSRFGAIVAGDANASYDVGRWVFETLLEHECGVMSNGHHVAQRLGAFLDTRLREVAAQP